MPFLENRRWPSLTPAAVGISIVIVGQASSAPEHPVRAEGHGSDLVYLAIYILSL